LKWILLVHLFEVMPNIEVFHFLAGPLGFTQKLKARFNAWIVREAINGDTATKFLPAIIFNQLGQNFLERDSVQRIVLLVIIHFVHESESFDYWEHKHPLYQGRG